MRAWQGASGVLCRSSAGRLWGDGEPRDVLAGDGEVPFEVGGAAGEVAGQATRDDAAVGTKCFGAGDLGRVGVFRGCAGLPGPDLRRAVALLAFVDDCAVVGE